IVAHPHDRFAIATHAQHGFAWQKYPRGFGAAKQDRARPRLTGFAPAIIKRRIEIGWPRELEAFGRHRRPARDEQAGAQQDEDPTGNTHATTPPSAQPPVDL